MAKHHPGRGGATWLRIESRCTYDTVRRAMNNEPILTEPARKRLSEATGGDVTEDELKAGGVRAKPDKAPAKVARKVARKGKARRKSAPGRKTSAVRSAA